MVARWVITRRSMVQIHSPLTSIVIFLSKLLRKDDFKHSNPTPIFGGSTGGWLRAAEVEEKYAITWTAKSEFIFEMPTGGAAIMQQGENLLYLARKEQCLALSALIKSLKSMILKFTVSSLVVKYNIYIQKMVSFQKK